MGRPPKPKGQVRHPVCIRLNPSEKKSIEAHAKTCGLSTSDFARKGLLYLVQNAIRIT